MFEDKDLLWDDEGKPRKVFWKKKIECEENTLSWKIKNMKYERVWFNKKIEV